MPWRFHFQPMAKSGKRSVGHWEATETQKYNTDANDNG